jgi:putative ABC transport system permease protein
MSVTRGAAWTYTCIGAFGLILASVGLAGVTAYTVARRRREIGIRMAIGARRSDVMRLVMKEGLTLVAIGAALGLLGARAGIRAMGGLVAEISRTAGSSVSDPVLLAGAPLLLASVALCACYLPARQSSRIDPVEALRQE